MPVTVTHIDTACIIIDINGFRIMTDPVLDQAGGRYHFGYGSVSKKSGNPALSANEIGAIDLILLSHHQHQDNFDRAGKAFARGVPLVLSTKKAVNRLPNVTGLDPWDVYEVATDKVPGLKITATPCRHHPAWLPGFFAGQVIGFVIGFSGLQNGAIYISGDTVLDKKLALIGQRIAIDVAILHLGAVQFPYLTGFARYTMNACEGASLAKMLNANRIIPVHTSGWSHFKENPARAQKAFAAAGLAGKTLWLQPGEKTVIID